MLQVFGLPRPLEGLRDEWLHLMQNAGMSCLEACKASSKDFMKMEIKTAICVVTILNLISANFIHLPKFILALTNAAFIIHINFVN